MLALLHVGETMLYGVDPLVVIGGAFWFVVIVCVLWTRLGGTPSTVAAGRTVNRHSRRQ
jgi:hypothetical protein